MHLKVLKQKMVRTISSLLSLPCFRFNDGAFFRPFSSLGDDDYVML